MPLILPSNSISAGGYEVANSLRFNSGSSDYLNKTPSSITNRQVFTISLWIKRATLSDNYRIFSAGTTATDISWIAFFGSNQFSFGHYNGSTVVADLTTSRVFRDTSGWYHIVIGVDSTQATSSDRVKIYVNGVQETSFSTTTYPSLNQNFAFNNTQSHELGRNVYSSGEYFNGYMAEVCLIDGQQLDPTSFGEFDEDTGIWKPKAVSGLTFGTNGFYLDFENSGSLGADVSGNGNNFTVNNLTSIDQTTDTPTNNYPTFNPLILVWSGNTALSDGNTKVTNPDSLDGSPPTTIGVISGKWYWEMKQENANDVFIGVCGDGFVSDDLANGYSGITSNATTGLLVYNSSGDKVVNGSTSSSFFTSYGSGDIIGIALDLDSATRTVTFYKNGVVDTQGAQNLPTNMQSGAVFGVAIVDDSAIVSLNFGNPPFTISSGNSDGNGYGNFEYSVPSGYYALNTKNLAEYG